MKKITLILISLIVFGCAKKEIKVPTLAVQGIQEVQNHSQIWIFLKEQQNDTIADLNRRNSIVSTNWIFNIDKNLQLKAIIPSISELQHKHSNSMHSKKGMHEYFSYSDTISKKLSFYEFDDVVFKTDSILSKYFIKENSSDYIEYNNLNLTFNPTNVWINDAKIEKSDFEVTLLEFIEFSSEGKQTLLHLNFNNRLNYQSYLYYRTLISSIENKNISSNKIEFIFDQNKVPDCGCE